MVLRNVIIQVVSTLLLLMTQITVTSSIYITKSIFIIILNFIFTCDINCVASHIKIHALP